MTLTLKEFTNRAQTGLKQTLYIVTTSTRPYTNIDGPIETIYIIALGI